MLSVPNYFQINSQQYGDTVVIRLGGEFDMAVEEHFDRNLERLAADAKMIVVDLSELQFIDSSGLRALLRAWRRSEADGASMAVVPGDGQVRHTMALTGVDDVLPIAAEMPVHAPEPA